MNERSSTPARLESDDGGTKVDHLVGLLSATASLDRAKEVLSHKETHEVRQACDLIGHAQEEISRIFEAACALGERIEGSEGLHGEDSKEA